MKSYRMHCLEIRRYPLLKQLLYTMWNSWLTMVGICLASILILTFIDCHSKSNLSEIASAFTLSCFFSTVFLFPINIYILLVIQCSGLIPFLMASPFLVCIESSIFFVTSLIINRLLFPTDNLSILISVIIVLGLSLIFKAYLKWRHNISFVARKRILRGLRSCYMINKEVDIFIILMILLILTLFFLSWK